MVRNKLTSNKLLSVQLTSKTQLVRLFAWNVSQSLSCVQSQGWGLEQQLLEMEVDLQE